MKKIGILGGTFNPIHNGHIKLAFLSKQQFDLNEIWIMPSFIPPHKLNNTITAFEDRVNMINLAISSYDGFICSEFEKELEDKSYTYRTLSILRERYPEYEFYFIMGADSLYEIETWKEPAKIMMLANLIVAKRDYNKSDIKPDLHAEYLRKKYNARINFIQCKDIDISSNRLREMVKNNKSIIKYVPMRVNEYILNRGLYK